MTETERSIRLLAARLLDNIRQNKTLENLPARTGLPALLLQTTHALLSPFRSHLGKVLYCN